MLKIISRLSALLALAAIALCMYPLLSSWMFQSENSYVLGTYQDTIDQSNERLLQSKKEQAIQYNSLLYQSLIQGITTDELQGYEYETLLSVGDNPVMAHIEIPKISVSLPVFHGTDEETLKKGAGHFASSSLPVGGMNTRSILSAHRGLPGASLFTRLDELEKGDLFYIEVLKEKLAYKVSEIEVILPEESEKLLPIADQDLVSLVTCTPYGINTHRLVVTGKRIAYDPIQYESIPKALPSWRELFFLGLPFLLAIFFIPSMLKSYRKKRKQKKILAFQRILNQEEQRLETY